MNRPSLSVAISNFNHARFMPDALTAILNQSYQPIELVVVDDASTDDSLAVLAAYQKRWPQLIRMIKNDVNKGVVHNTHHLASVVKGDYVFMAAMDDRILPGFFARCMALLAQYPRAGLCSTLSRIMNEAGHEQGLVKMPVVLEHEGFIVPEDVPATLHRHANWMMGNATIYRRQALIDAGGFRAELGPYCDGFASLAIALKCGACFIPEPLAVWRRMAGTYSDTVGKNADAVLDILKQAECLMRNDYRDLFPADYVDEWRQEMHFRIASTFATSERADGFAQAARIVPPQTFLHRSFYVAARAWPAFGRALAKLYFFSVLRRDRIWRTLGRRLTHLRLART